MANQNNQDQQQGQNQKQNQGGDARGFGAMDKDQQTEISRKGGESVSPEQRSFSKDPELAREAGRKGGESRANEDRSSSDDTTEEGGEMNSRNEEDNSRH